ncbi:MAG: PDZ domain-containing protein [Planctomycetales bacterium]|nr:PDZ domain-containing protein [Planctomycetales bacterium]
MGGRAKLLAAVTFAAALAAAAAAQEKAPGAGKLERGLAALRQSVPDDPARPLDEIGPRGAAVEAALALRPSVEEIGRALRSLPSPKTAAGWTATLATDERGASRPYLLYVPAAVARDRKPAPLLVYLHGGISRNDFPSEGEGKSYGEMWTASADRHGIVLAVPLARADCAWWTDAGAAHVRAAVRDAKRRAPVDDDRVLAAGFSHGGSGCWYLALAAPDPFAGFIPMNGHPAIASQGSSRQLYLENLRATPLFVAHTQDDTDFPLTTLLPHLDAAIALGSPLRRLVHPEGGHSPAYFQPHEEEFAKFVLEARREPHAREVSWRAAHVETGRRHWLEVEELGAAAGDAPEEPDRNVEIATGRVLLGITVDQAFAGPGVRVTAVNAGSIAEALGVRPGDAIVTLDGKPVGGLTDLRRLLLEKRAGQPISVSIRREGEKAPRESSGAVPTDKPAAVYARALRTARISARREGNAVEVVSRGVRRFRLLLSPEALDFSAEVVVRVNGTERFRGKPAPDLRRALARYAAEADARRFFPAEVVVELPAAGG